MTSTATTATTEVATAETPVKVKAATWVRSSKTSWDVGFNGYNFSASKVDGTWALYVWNELQDDWNDVDYGDQVTALRPFWSAVSAYLADSEYATTPNPLTGYVPPAEDANDSDELVTPADPEWGDQGDSSEHAAACPKCGKSGDEKCVTKSGKPVKENGGYHAVRTV